MAYSTNCATHTHYETVYFEQATTEELRSMVEPPWPDATRAQLLAYFHNRYRCGYFKRFSDADTQG